MENIISILLNENCTHVEYTTFRLAVKLKKKRGVSGKQDEEIEENKNNLVLFIENQGLWRNEKGV